MTTEAKIFALDMMIRTYERVIEKVSTLRSYTEVVNVLSTEHCAAGICNLSAHLFTRAEIMELFPEFSDSRNYKWTRPTLAFGDDFKTGIAESLEPRLEYLRQKKNELQSSTKVQVMPFNAEQALAGMPIMTRDCCRVEGFREIPKEGQQGSKRFEGWVFSSTSGWQHMTWTNEGSTRITKDPHSLDLVMAPKPKKTQKVYLALFNSSEFGLQSVSSARKPISVTQYPSWKLLAQTEIDLEYDA